MYLSRGTSGTSRDFSKILIDFLVKISEWNRHLKFKFENFGSQRSFCPSPIPLEDFSELIRGLDRVAKSVA